jgi:hypothetical protein
MIHLLDNLLRQIFMEEAAALSDEAQIRFQPPDADWRTYVSNLTIGGNPANALNIYLVDLRENRKLRSNERVRTIENGIVNEEPAPARVDCHYLISAWSPAAVTLLEPALEEHALLYQTVAVLMRNSPFNPSRVYPAGSAPLNVWPPKFRDVDLPAVVLPIEGFSKLAEFWSGMGQGALWKPAIYLIATLPVELLTEVAGPMVTTRITEYRISGHPETAEVWIQLGGHVFSPARPVAIANATVTAIAGGGTLVTVDNASNFRAGDTITSNNIARTTITQIAGNVLTLRRALAGLAVGNILRIANITPSQSTFRVSNATGLVPGGAIVIRGEDASNPGSAISDHAVIEAIASSGFVSLKATPVRTKTFNMNVTPTNAPTVQEALPRVWVEFETLAGERVQITQTDELGRFTFRELRAGQYRLRTRALDLPEITRDISVPSPSGEYDLQFA